MGKTQTISLGILLRHCHADFRESIKGGFKMTQLGI